VPRPRHRPQLTIRVVYVHDANAEAAFDRVLDLLADAITDLSIAEAKAEVAGRLGVTPESIDHERGHLDAADRADLHAISERGAA
jgi:hypothetical protein